MHQCTGASQPSAFQACTGTILGLGIELYTIHRTLYHRDWTIRGGTPQVEGLFSQDYKGIDHPFENCLYRIISEFIDPNPLVEAT